MWRLVRNNVCRGLCYGLFVDYFLLFCACRLQVGKWCNYFEWHDLVANSRQKRIIVALMKKVDELNLREKDLYTKISDMKMKGKFLGIGLVFSWVCVCLLVFLLCCRGM